MRRRIKSLDSLKGICIFLIVIYHTADGILRVENTAMDLIYKYGGDLGNTFFFMISGFLITATFRNHVLQNKISLFEFMKGRISKIYLPYLLSSLCMSCIIIKQAEISALTLKNIVLNLLLITTGWVEDIYPFNFPCWFLSVLILMYLIWFIVTKKYGENSWYVYLMLIICGFIFEKLCLTIPFMYYHTGEGLVPFFGGCIIYKICQDVQKNQLIHISLTLMSTTVFFLIYAKNVGFESAVGEWKYAWYFLVTPTMILLAVYIQPIRKILESRVIYWLCGDISVVVYFWHAPYTKIFSCLIENRLANSTCLLFVLYILSLIVFAKAYVFLKNKMVKKDGIY